MGNGPADSAGLPQEIIGDVTDAAKPAQVELRLDKPQKKTPERRCIVSGESGPRLPLLRFVAAPADAKGNSALVFDAAEKLPGRGCYVSADPTLLQHAIDRKLFARALKTKLAIPSDLQDQVTTQLMARILAALGLAKKSGALAIGEEAVEQSLTRDTALTALAVSDASPRTATDLATKAARYEIGFIALPCDAATLGPALGRDNAVYLALLDLKGNAAVAAALTRDCARLTPFVITLNQNTARYAGQKVDM